MKIIINSKKLYLWSFFLAIIALIVTANLVYIHYKPVTTGSFCDINAYWNCDRVNQSTFAEFLGMPVSIFGFLFYIFLSLNLFGVFKGFNYRRYYPVNSSWLLLLIALFGVIESGVITYLEYPVYQFNQTFQFLVIIKNLVFALVFLWLLFGSRHLSESKKFLVYMTSLALFGFAFSFYLTGIELLVLEGICIFCLAQQTLIFLILIFLFISQYRHERIKT